MLRRLFGGRTDKPPRSGAADAPEPAVDATLAYLEAGHDQFAIFDAGRGRYLQVSVADDGSLYGEAVSNTYLKGNERIGDDAILALASMGWTMAPDPNYSRTWDAWQGDARVAVVDDILETLMLAYEMPADGPLDITTGT